MLDPDEVSVALASVLKSQREHASLSQAAVATAARLRGTTTYQRLEHHQRPCSIPQLVAIANVFTVPPHQLLHAAELGSDTSCGAPDDAPESLDPIAVSKAVAAELRWRREHLGFTLAEVAVATGMRWITSYQRLESHERRCVIPQLVAIANVLGLPPHEILHAAELRAMAGELPADRTGLRKAFRIDP